MNEFQYRFKKSLANSKLTASELSNRTGISEANISNYINGKYIPKQEKCYALARELNVDPWWLLTGEEPTSKRSEVASIVVTDNKLFAKLVQYMTLREYETVMKAYENAYTRMKEEEGTE